METFRIQKEMNGKTLAYTVQELVDDLSEPFWFWKNPKVVGKRWRYCGTITYGRERSWIKRFYFKTKKRAEQYINDRKEVENGSV